MNKHQKPVLTGQRFKTRKRGRLGCVFVYGRERGVCVQSSNPNIRLENVSFNNMTSISFISKSEFIQ